MKWDPFIDQQPKPQPTQHERLDVPEGTHDLQIKQILESDDELEVRLVHDDRRYGWVFCHLPKKEKWAAIRGVELGQALGMTREEWLACEPGDLVGRRVRAEIRHKVGNNGRMYVNVWTFSEAGPAPEPPPETRPRATVAQRIGETAQFEKDDIPF